MNIEINEENRWVDLDRVLLRPSKFAPEDFTPGEEVYTI